MEKQVYCTGNRQGWVFEHMPLTKSLAFIQSIYCCDTIICMSSFHPTLKSWIFLGKKIKKQPSLCDNHDNV